MTHIVQIAPNIGQGSGVAGVAWNLERQFLAKGHTVERFTYAQAGHGHARPMPSHRLLRALALFRRMVWFTTVGTMRARRFLRERPDAVSICHNNVLAGDVYVNHGVVAAAMRARGHGVWRMLRNPTHPFTFVRDAIRYRFGLHRAVVALSDTEEQTLRGVYGKVRSRVVVIPNGVDLDAYHPPSPYERREARDRFRLDDDARVALFVGHEFSRKGLHLAIEALAQAPTVLLLVVGGNADSIPVAEALAEKFGVRDRVLFTGTQFGLQPFFAAADWFTLPSAYEANALVVLEALASGLPVVVTPVGAAPDVVIDGANGILVPREPAAIAAAYEQLAWADLAPWRRRARESAEEHGWQKAADRYLDLADEILRDRRSEGHRRGRG